MEKVEILLEFRGRLGGFQLPRAVDADAEGGDSAIA